MTTSSGRSKVLVILVIVLVLTNAGMLYYFTTGCKKEEEKPIGRAEAVGKELQLDSAQMKTYIELRARRDSAIKPLQLELRAAKLNLISLIHQENVSDSLVNTVLNTVASKQQPIEKEYYLHYLRMKSLLTPEQLVRFDSAITRMIRRNTGGE